MSINYNEYVVLDLETTGLSPSNCEIIELAAIKIRNNVIVDSFETLVKPKNGIPDYITEITGITPNMVENKKEIEYVFKDFLTFIDSEVLIGHNISFDMRFIGYNMQKLGLDVHFYKPVDTLYYSRKFIKSVPNYKLSTLIDFFGIPQKPNHRALDDCIATNELYKIICACEKDENEVFLKKYLNSVQSDVLCGKTVVFKGTPSLCSYDVYSALCEKAGGTASDTFSSYKTDYIVFCKNTYAKFLRGDFSAKMLKAIDLVQSKGLVILSEYDFMQLIGLDIQKPSKKPKQTKYRSIDVKSIVPMTDEFDEAHPLFEKTCVFTGTLEKMSRKVAMQHVVDLGGKLGSNVTKQTNYLILGCNDFNPLIKDGKSSKQKKAEEYRAAGYDIEIIDEDIFYSMLDD